MVQQQACHTVKFRTEVETSINNCGGWVPEDIQELPLLAVSPWMETTPMTGKSWQPTHEPPCSRGERQVPVTLIKSAEKGYGMVVSEEHKQLTNTQYKANASNKLLIPQPATKGLTYATPHKLQKKNFIPFLFVV